MMLMGFVVIGLYLNNKLLLIKGDGLKSLLDDATSIHL